MEFIGEFLKQKQTKKPPNFYEYKRIHFSIKYSDFDSVEEDCSFRTSFTTIRIHKNAEMLLSLRST